MAPVIRLGAMSDWTETATAERPAVAPTAKDKNSVKEQVRAYARSAEARSGP
jgi:hypothetical protein